MSIRKSNSARAWLAASSLSAIALGATVLTQAPQGPAAPDRSGLTTYVRDLTKELANKMSGTYVVAAVGDLLMQEPMGQMIDPSLRKILKDADTTIGNKEGYVLE